MHNEATRTREMKERELNSRNDTCSTRIPVNCSTIREQFLPQKVATTRSCPTVEALTSRCTSRFHLKVNLEEVIVSSVESFLANWQDHSYITGSARFATWTKKLHGWAVTRTQRSHEKQTVERPS